MLGFPSFRDRDLFIFYDSAFQSGIIILSLKYRELNTGIVFLLQHTTQQHELFSTKENTAPPSIHTCTDSFL